MFSLVSLSESKFSTLVALVPFVSHWCHTRVTLVSFVSHSWVVRIVRRSTYYPYFLREDGKYVKSDYVVSRKFLTKYFTNCWFWNSWISLDDRIIRMFNKTLRVSLDFQIYFTVNHCVKSVQIRSFLLCVFSRIRTEYGEIRMRENTDQKKLRIWTLFTQSTHSVIWNFEILDTLKHNTFFIHDFLLRKVE